MLPGRTFDRREVLGLCTKGALLLSTPLAGCSSETMLRTKRNYGASLCAWDAEVNRDVDLWRLAVRDMHKIGLTHVALVSYAYVNPETGIVRTNSSQGLDPGPSIAVLTAAADEARALGMECSIRPWVEIDGQSGPGVEWRGDFELGGRELDDFAQSYREYILELSDLARSADARCMYIGSELKGLTTDEKASDHWFNLIENCRNTLKDTSCLLSYAANFDEFEDIPFWTDLDEIGIDAYFPIANIKQAQGSGKPTRSVLDKGCRRIFGRLEKFSRKIERPVYICEWGLVPLDGTTADPSNELPSTQSDVEEVASGYDVFLSNASEQGNWLVGVDFWHWQVAPDEDSNYRIVSDSQVARIIQVHLKAKEVPNLSN